MEGGSVAGGGQSGRQEVQREGAWESVVHSRDDPFRKSNLNLSFHNFCKLKPEIGCFVSLTSSLRLVLVIFLVLPLRSVVQC